MMFHFVPINEMYSRAGTVEKMVPMPRCFACGLFCQNLQVDLEAACRHHQNAFSDPSEFTLVLTGNVSFPALLPLVTTYLATIPIPGGGTGKGRKDCRSLTALPFQFPDAPAVEDVEVRCLLKIHV
jgi:hypothetical protein